MNHLSEFLNALFTEGEVVYEEAPVPTTEPDQECLAILQRAFEDSSKELIGPPLPFRPAIAVRAAEFVRHACWFLVSHREPPEIVEQALQFPHPQDVGDHLSADLLLRYIPFVERRARALNPSDVLSRRLNEVLLAWPLSGVLSDVMGSPTTPPDFDHPGLRMLYAERFAKAEKPGWLPGGAGREFLELVYADLGRAVPEPPVLNESESHVGN